MRSIVKYICAAPLLWATSCAPDIYPRSDDRGFDAEFNGSHFESEVQDNGHVWVEVNATDDKTWIYFDLDTLNQVEPGDPQNALDWDIAFQRFNIKINGGVHGVGNVEVVPIKTADFESVIEAPDNGWLVDLEDGDDDNSNPDYVISSIEPWFDYDIRFHTLSPRELTYIIRSTGSGLSKFQIQGYYDDAGTSAFISFLWTSLGESDTN